MKMPSGVALAHTYKFDLPGYGEIDIVANSDFSGLAAIHYTTNVGERCVAILPGELLLYMSKQVAVEYVRSEIISFLEGLEVEAVLPVHVGSGAFDPVGDDERTWAGGRWIVRGHNTEKSEEITILTEHHEQPCTLVYVKAYNGNAYHNAQRICECVSAMQGIRDPKAFIQGMKPSVDPMRLLELVRKCEREAADGSLHDAHVDFIDEVKDLVSVSLGLSREEGR
jgi:hypothetical protein